jgi:hypothetical protein
MGLENVFAAREKVMMDRRKSIGNRKKMSGRGGIFPGRVKFSQEK